VKNWKSGLAIFLGFLPLVWLVVFMVSGFLMPRSADWKMFYVVGIILGVAGLPWNLPSPGRPVWRVMLGGNCLGAILICAYLLAFGR